MRVRVLLLALLAVVPAAGGNKDRVWQHGRVRDVSSRLLTNLVQGADAANGASGIGNQTVRQRLEVESEAGLFIAEQTVMPGREPRFVTGAPIDFALDRGTMVVRDGKGRKLRYRIVWRGARAAPDSHFQIPPLTPVDKKK